MSALFGFKNTLIIVMASLLIIALGVAAYISSSQLQLTATDNLITYIKSATTYESENIEQYIAQKSQPAAEFAKLYGQSDYTADIAKSLAFAANLSGVYKFTLGLNDGRPYASRPQTLFINGAVDPTRYDPRTRPWYTLGKNVSALTLNDVFFTNTGDLFVNAVHPVNGGVLLAEIRLGNLQKVLEGIRVISGSTSMIIDDDGMVFASTNEKIDIKDKIQDISDLDGFSDKVFTTDTVIDELVLNGINSVIISTEINLLGGKKWYLIVSVDRDIAYAPVHNALQQQYISSIVIAVFFVVILIFFLAKLYQPVLALKKVVQNLSSGNGDLTQRLDITSKDDLGDIAQGINIFIETLQKMIIEVKMFTGQLSNGVNNLRIETSESNKILDQHNLETNQIVTAIEELSVTAQFVASNATDAAEFTQEANTSGEASRATIINAQNSLEQLVKEVDQATKNVTEMSNETQEISSILGVIGGIAEQTNLLALNAAIEAARAGEQGRGFAVVADEVRALAARTQDSTGKIDKGLEKLQLEAITVVSSITTTKKTSEETVKETVKISTSLKEMSDYVTKINDLSTQISTSANEQNVVILDISETMHRIHNMTDKLTNTGSVVFDEVNQIATVNEALANIINQFKVLK